MMDVYEPFVEQRKQRHLVIGPAPLLLENSEHFARHAFVLDVNEAGSIDGFLDPGSEVVEG